MTKSRGSEWSIWDLHIHTPKSIVQCYGGDTTEIWERFILALEALPSDVKAIGINDYYFIDGFEEVMKYKRQGRLANIEKIFPVIEFRIDTFSSAGSTNGFNKINLHVLFNINDEECEKEIKLIREQFICQLKVSGLDKHNTYTLTKENMIECSSEKTLVNGFSELIPSTKEVFKLINSDVWRNRTFIFIGYKEWDELNKLDQLKQHKQMIFDVADAFFTGSPTHNQTSKEEILNIFGSRPLVHSLDIHDFSSLDKNNYKCFTWIKGSRTFDGLCQIKFEPKERIKITTNNPQNQEIKSNIIESLKIRNSENWFSEDELLLNRGLITIIGEKGSGKTALLDILATCNGEGIFETDKNNPSSFYFRTKKDNQLKNMCVELKHAGYEADEHIDYKDILVDTKSNPNAKVRYLSLKELENYSSSKDELQTFLQTIINSNNAEINSIQYNIQEITKDIYDTNVKISENIDKCSNKNEKVKRWQSLVDELNAHIKMVPQLKTTISEDENKHFQELITKDAEKDREILQLTNIKNEISEYIKWKEEYLSKATEKVKSDLLERANEFSHISSMIKDKLSVQIELIGLESLSDEDKLNDEKLIKIQKTKSEISDILKPLLEKNTSFKEEQDAMKIWLLKKNELEQNVDAAKKDIERIEEYEKRVQEYLKIRREKYAELINKIINLKAKFDEMKDRINDGVISFSVGVEFNERKLIEKEDALINHGSGFSKDNIINKLLPIYTKLADSMNELKADQEDLSVAIENIIQPILGADNLELFLKDNFGKSQGSLLKKTFGLTDFYNFIYDNYFLVNYDIMFNGKLLRLLSPGQKGLVLMKLFLRLDTNTKPILIDQPEDNLDNKSVFTELIDDFREVKKKRQVIIATHNPNLVVNTDAEQVIVATFKDVENGEGIRIQYESGGIEDIRIRNAVCLILEGGQDAFRKREERYNPLQH